MRSAAGNLCIGLIGFGAVGRSYASALLHAGVRLQVYNPAPRPETAAAATEMGLALHGELDASVNACDLMLNAAPGSQALPLAQAAAPFLKPGALFADLSSAAPDDVRAAAACFPAGAYVDVAILGAVSIHGHATPMLASGAGATTLQAMLNPLGFVIDTLPDGRPGDATTLKLLRSILTKGLDALVIECLLVAESQGLRNALLANLGDLDQSPFSALMAMFVRTHAPHAVRRLEEMQAVEAMLKDVDVPLMMTPATTRRYAHSVDVFAGAQPPAASALDQVDGETVAWMLAAERRSREKAGAQTDQTGD